MAEDTNNPETGNKGGGDDGGNKGGDDGKNSFKPVTFNSQEEYDAAMGERATRAANSAKAEALKAFQEAGASPDEALEAWKAHKAAEDAKKDPAVKGREKHDRTQRELQAYKDKEARDKLSIEVAKGLKLKVGEVEHPIPAELLNGSTKEEMQASGKAIMEFFNTLGVTPGGRRAPGYNPLQGQNGDDKITAGDPLRNFLQTGSFI